MVRGKAKSPVEFGAKVSISFVERIGWDAHNESCDLTERVEGYRKRFGFYPESVHVDKIYRTLLVRRWLSAKLQRTELTHENHIAADLTAPA